MPCGGVWFHKGACEGGQQCHFSFREDLYVFGLVFDVGRFSLGDIWGNTASIKVWQWQTRKLSPGHLWCRVHYWQNPVVFSRHRWSIFHSHRVKDQRGWHIACCSITFLPLSQVNSECLADTIIQIYSTFVVFFSFLPFSVKEMGVVS